ncbi:MAG: winged helix-turn-helix domain-containing protein, partial [Umezawaea sp.]
LGDAEGVAGGYRTAYGAGGVRRVQAAFAARGRYHGRVAVELAAELRHMADWLGLDGVVVMPKGDLAGALGAVVR